MVAVLFAIALNLHAIREIVALSHAIAEQVEHSGYTPKDAKEAALEKQQDDTPVKVTGPMSFMAGGYEWHWSDFYKNAAIFGQSGSGKTICVLNAVLDGLLEAAAAGSQEPSGLILDPKGDFRDKIDTSPAKARLARPAGDNRSDRSPELRPLESSRLRLERYRACRPLCRRPRDDQRERRQGPLLHRRARTFFGHMVTILRTIHPDRPPDLAEIYDAGTDDELSSSLLDDWPDETGTEARRASGYVVNEWTTLADRHEIRGALVPLEHARPFLVPPYDTLFAGRSTVSIGEAIDRGRILYVYLPLARAEIYCPRHRHLRQARILSRGPGPARTRRVPSFFLCDEFQSFFTVGAQRGDADAFERTRQSNHANIIAFQNLNALYKQTQRKEPVDNLLGNCATQIFLRNTDWATNEYASKLFGEHVETLLGIGSSLAARTGATAIADQRRGAIRRQDPRERLFKLAVPSQPDGIAFAESMTLFGARLRFRRNDSAGQCIQ